MAKVTKGKPTTQCQTSICQSRLPQNWQDPHVWPPTISDTRAGQSGEIQRWGQTYSVPDNTPAGSAPCSVGWLTCDPNSKTTCPWHYTLGLTATEPAQQATQQLQCVPRGEDGKGMCQAQYETTVNGIPTTGKKAYTGGKFCRVNYELAPWHVVQEQHGKSTTFPWTDPQGNLAWTANPPKGYQLGQNLWTSSLLGDTQNLDEMCKLAPASSVENCHDGCTTTNFDSTYVEKISSDRKWRTHSVEARHCPQRCHYPTTLIQSMDMWAP